MTDCWLSFPHMAPAVCIVRNVVILPPSIGWDIIVRGGGRRPACRSVRRPRVHGVKDTWPKAHPRRRSLVQGSWSNLSMMVGSLSPCQRSAR